jgi:RNA polymerase sigma-70 factor, ECF subfamily
MNQPARVDAPPKVPPEAADRTAFEALFRAHYEGLLRFVVAHLDDRGAAEDVVHDVFLRLWSDRDRLRSHDSPRSYLLAAVRNRIIDQHRRRALERRWIVALPTDAEAESEAARVQETADRTEPSDPASVAQLEERIRRAVAELPERCRTAFLLCREQELSYAEAAEVMGVSPATVKTQMARALAAMRAALAPFLLVLLFTLFV